jgi:regulator of sigma E protease
MRRHGRDRTEWAISAFPLGGYVKMLDEREGDVAVNRLAARLQPADRSAGAPSSWRQVRPPTSCWPSCSTGSSSCMALPSSSRASVRRRRGRRRRWRASSKAGTVRAVNGRAIATWQELRWEVIRLALDKEDVRLEVISQQREIATYRFASDRFDVEELENDPLRLLGLVLYRPPLPALVGMVQSGSAAAQAGFRDGDRVLAIDGTGIATWAELAAAARAAPDRQLRFTIERDGGRLELLATPRPVEEGGQKSGRLGLMAREGQGELFAMTIVVSYGPLESVTRALRQTWDTSILSLRMMGRMLTGELSWKNLSGPVTIADYAGQSAKLGPSYYLRFLALISISLGVLNLLPVPVLDGGHLMYYLVEFLKGGPVSERALEIGQQIGFALLALLMAFAFYNDINRLVSG